MAPDNRAPTRWHGDGATDLRETRVLRPRQWWAQFPDLTQRFDAAYVVEGLGDLIEAKVSAWLLRREVKIAVDVVTRHLNRPSSPELADRAASARTRLAATLARIDERSDGGMSTVEAGALSLALNGDYPGAAVAAARFVRPGSVELLFVTALRLERFDIEMALRLLDGGQQPHEAVRSGQLLGRYGWWPSWLLLVVTERALAGTLDDAMIEALDRCAYAELSPAQASLARKLLNGNENLIATAAQRLAQMGEARAGERLREGDLNTVALAARLIGLQ
jgi:hypothetical protein